jgi:4,5-DOPA dioxygenase extradiol
MFPAVFIGHGSPMNSIEENEFTREWKKIGKAIPTPTAILAISAHWETRRSQVTAMENPRTIHDFYGFPEILFKQNYPAPGSPELAKEVIRMTGKEMVFPDYYNWGLDHGTWSILHHMFPNADVPVVQLSLDTSKTPKQHFELARKLMPLREKNILVICSGNIVHNLGMVKWKRMELSDGEYPWAKKFDALVKESLVAGKEDDLINFSKLTRDTSLAVPSAEHFLPLIYLAGIRSDRDRLKFHCEKIVGGSLSMTSVELS